MTTIAAASREVATHRRGSSTALRREWFTSAVVTGSLGLFVSSLNAAGVATVIGAVSKVHLWFGAVLLLGGVTPLGALASESSKVLVLPAGCRTRCAGAALAVENLCYILSVVVGFSIGAALLLVAFGRSTWTMLVFIAAVVSLLGAIGLAVGHRVFHHLFAEAPVGHL